MSRQNGGAPGHVEKLMAMTLAEFHRSLKTLVPGISLQSDQTLISFETDGKPVSIEFVAREGVTLGGLLALPRARVTIELERLDREERERFLARFDRAFQRGGG